MRRACRPIGIRDVAIRAQNCSRLLECANLFISTILALLKCSLIRRAHIRACRACDWNRRKAINLRARYFSFPRRSLAHINCSPVIYISFLFRSTYVSVLTIVAFSTERFLAICYPLHLYAMSGFKRAVRIIALLWIISFLSAVPFGCYSTIHYIEYPPGEWCN